MRFSALSLVVGMLGVCGACGVFGADDPSSTPDPAGTGSDAGAGEGAPPVGGPAAGNFTLNPVPTTIRVAHGTSVKIPVKVNRADSTSEDIQIIARGFRDGITAKPLTLRGRADSGDLELTVPPGAPTGPANGFIDANGGVHSASTPLNAFVRGRPGEIDKTFGTNGSVGQLYGATGGGASVVAMLLEADDSILVVGGCGAGIIGPASGLCVVHLSADGHLDKAYGTGGVGSLSIGSPTAAALQPDGKLVVVTDGHQAGRLDATGQPDATFGDGSGGGPGTLLLTTGGLDGTNNGAYAVAVRSDGDIFVAWDNMNAARTVVKNGSMRLAPDGSLRTAYGLSGTARSAPGYTTAIIVRNNPASASKGNLAMVFTGLYSDNIFSIEQLNGDTSGADPKFLPTIKTATISGATRSVVGVGAVELADESIIAAVSGSVGGVRGVFLRKCAASGDAAVGFGAAGTAGPFLGSVPGGIAVQADGKIVVAVTSSAGAEAQDALRFTSSGTLDPDFAPNGHPLNPTGSGQKVVVQKSGRIVIGGRIGATDTLIAGYWP